ncbi:exosortase A [Photobacterium sp. BZF1]|uniref:exosortase A n=1 Tax=Photobacterium sp. BZF1 TaxID=1904457 RepID=UPI001653D722|nr:exosortase A [Photobacterium sp. BZF1]
MISLPVLRFTLPLFAWIIVYHESIQSMVTVWSQSKTFEHCFIIAPISLWLTWQKRKEIQATPLSTAWLPVLLFCLPTLCWMLGKASGVALLEHIAVISSLQLLLWALLGTQLAKLLFFPIFYLSFCIPFGEEIVPQLQVITADITVFALQLSNIPVYRDGLFLAIPNGLFEVAEACSGIRFLISSVALGTLFAYLNFNKVWKITVFVVFSFIFPIIANGVRAYGIVLIGHLSDMKYATGADHLVYGWVFFSLVIGIIFFVASRFADPSVIKEQRPNYQPHKQTSGKVFSLIVCLVAILFIQSKWARTLHVTDTLYVTPIPLPLSAEVTETNSSWGISFPQAIETISGISKDGSIEYFSARYLVSQQTGELISSSNHLYDQDKWSLNANANYVISPTLSEAFTATQLTVVNRYGHSKKILFWYCIDDFCSNNPIKIKLLKAAKLMTGQSATADVLALASSNSSDEQLQELAVSWMTYGKY